MIKKIGVSIGSTWSIPGEIHGNLTQISDFAKRASLDGADLLVTPEMSVTGCGGYPEILATAEEAGNGLIYDRLAEITASSGVVISAGFVEASGEKRFNSQYIVYPGGKYVVQRKHRITAVEYPLDPAVKLKPKGEYDCSGQPEEVHFEYFDICGVRCVQVICADGGIDGLMDIMVDNNVELLLLSTAGGGKREDKVTVEDLKTEKGLEIHKQWVNITWNNELTDCIRYGFARAAINMCGYDGRSMYHGGGGSIVNSFGELVAFTRFNPVIDRVKPLYAFAEVDICRLR